MFAIIHTKKTTHQLIWNLIIPRGIDALSSKKGINVKAISHKNSLSIALELFYNIIKLVFLKINHFIFFMFNFPGFFFIALIASPIFIRLFLAP